jgi:SAM-dependent methyltransferase
MSTSRAPRGNLSRGSRARPGRFGNAFSAATVSGGLSYFEYQYAVGRAAVIPWLAGRIDLRGARVADLGCHHAGVLAAFRDHAGAGSGVGVDSNPRVLAESPFEQDARFTLEVGDAAALRADPRFDIVLLHDVLEHLEEPVAALQTAAGLLAENGKIFASFPPYYSAFGGHQQLAAGRVRAIPFLHLLPARAFFRLARPSANEYMSSENALVDMLSVRRTRLTLRTAEQAFAQAGLEIVDRALFVVRPEYTVRYGMTKRGAGPLGRIPLLRELAVNGAFYLARRSR